MNFIIDAQLPKSLSDFLNEKGHHSIHTCELLNKNKTTDKVITELAEIEERVVVTKDFDFLQSHLVKGRPSKLLLVKTGNISNKELVHLFQRFLGEMVHFLNENSLIEMYINELIVQ